MPRSGLHSPRKSLWMETFGWMLWSKIVSLLVEGCVYKFLLWWQDKTSMRKKTPTHTNRTKMTMTKTTTTKTATVKVTTSMANKIFFLYLIYFCEIGKLWKAFFWFFCYWWYSLLTFSGVIYAGFLWCSSSFLSWTSINEK